MKCPRCRSRVPTGTTLSACCGVWLFTNGPPPPGTVVDATTIGNALRPLRRHFAWAYVLLASVNAATLILALLGVHV